MKDKITKNISESTEYCKNNLTKDKMCTIGTWFCMLVAVVQLWGWWAATELLATKAIVLDSSTTSAASAGGNSLITHSTTAEGIDEPGNSVRFRIKGEETISKSNQSIIEWKT